MPRPFKTRRICCEPDSDYFKPRGIPVTALEEASLSLDELEAMRLGDLEGMYQEEAAKKMNISRQTFGNIITSARKKVTDALVNAKALKIKGGVVKMMERHFVCYGCKKEWTLPHGSGRPDGCPECKSVNIHRAPQDRGWARAARGRCRSLGQGFGHGKSRCGRG